MPDEISRLSAESARDPSGRASIQLVEALRRARRLEAARDAARRALSRHPYDAEAHDVYARVTAELGDEVTALDEWEMAIRLDPARVGALLGLAFLAFRRGDLDEASRRAEQARRASPDDPRLAPVESMLARARAERLHPAAPREPSPPVPATNAPAKGSTDARTTSTLFAPVLAEGAHAALLVDEDGLVVAGEAAPSWEGGVADDMAAELSGLGGESTRALEQLGLGSWEGLTVECDDVTLSIAPALDERLIVVATPESTPKGMARVLLARARQRAERWMEAL